MSRLTPRIRIFVAVVVTAALSAGVTSVMTAGATTPTTTYYACLKAGKLTKVGTVAPTCKAPATQISWNSVGPQGPPGPVNPTTYDWSGSVPSTGFGTLTSSLDGSTVIPTGSIVSLVAGTITGNFTSCTDGPTTVYFNTPGDNVANWSQSGNVTGAAPTSTKTVTLSSGGAMSWQVVCSGFGSLPTVSFNVIFTVTPPPTIYS